MTTQHTHPESGDVQSQDVVEQHAPDMQATTDESTPATASEHVEQLSQSNQTEDSTTSPESTPMTVTIPALLSFAIPVASPTQSASHEGNVVDAAQVGQVSQVSQVSDDMTQTSEQTSEQAIDGVSAVEALDTSNAVDTTVSAVASEIATSDEQEAETDRSDRPNAIQTADIHPLSVDEALPLEPASHALVHEITDTLKTQETQATSAEQEVSSEPDEMTVRPFMEYFEEFRQSEARSLSDAPDAFTEFALSATGDIGTSTEEVLPPFDFGEGSSFIPTEDETTSSATVNANETSDETAQSPMEAAIAEENQRVAAVEQEQTEHSSSIPQERPVSPLLRRDNRHRPRHSGSSHREEFVRSQGSETPSAESAQPVSEGQSQTTQEAQSTENTAETPVETPKPARRYRFDRPAQQGTRSYGVASSHNTSTNGGTITPAASVTLAAPVTSVVSPASEHTTVSPVSQVTPEAQSVSTGTTPTGVSTTQPQEEQALKPEAATIEQSATESATSTPSTTGTSTEHGRRKHGQDRQRDKESQTPASAPTAPTVQPAEATPGSVADIAALVAETHDALQGDVPPEDLPPLEYADLQKGNPRRRRRHRNGTTVTTSIAPKVQEVKAQETPVMPEVQAPVAPVAPVVQPAAQQGVTPRTPIQPAQPVLPLQSPVQPAAQSPTQAAQSNQSYTLTSGYTVNQMNQGNDNTGPFMGPEPSPARGSVFTRDGRTTRAENIRPSSYTSRDNGATGGGGISSASMNHFANVVAQAIQVQSDRMVAEMRRVNQAPTNVSVSLPPFPSTERVGVFVDVANLLYSARTNRIAIDFGKLLDFLRGNRRLVRAHAYCPTSPQPGDEQMFLQAVKGLGYRITTKNYKVFASGAKKADLDLDLCMDVVRLVDGHAVDDIVLVSGDSDFMPMLDYCSDHGVRVEIAAFDEAMSATLRQSCDLFINLSMLEEIRA